MERTFQILAVILIGIAAFLVWKGNTDAVFVSAVAGAVCFFLSVRFQIGERVKQRKNEETEEKLIAAEHGYLFEKQAAKIETEKMPREDKADFGNRI